METKVESLEGNKVKVTVTVDAADIDGRIKKTYKDFARKYNFPGFRKGKAPRPVIDNALGAEAVVGTVTEELLNGTWTAAIDEAKPRPGGRPGHGDQRDREAGEPYEYSFTIELRPEVELTSYEPVAIEMPFAEATDAEIDEQVEAMAEHYTDYEDASAAIKMKPENYADLTMKATDADGNEIAALTERVPSVRPRVPAMLSEAFRRGDPWHEEGPDQRVHARGSRGRDGRASGRAGRQACHLRGHLQRGEEEGHA